MERVKFIEMVRNKVVGLTNELMPLAEGALHSNEQLVVTVSVVMVPNLVVVAQDSIGSEHDRILNMTFRAFVNQKLKGDRRIGGIPFFHGHLNGNPSDPHYGGAPADFKNYSTFGDIPMRVLINRDEFDLLRIRGVSTKALKALKEILGGYGLSIKKQ